MRGYRERDRTLASFAGPEKARENPAFREIARHAEAGTSGPIAVADRGVGPMIIRDRGRRGGSSLAPAKLNLFLEILGKRPDGYHELESLMVAVDLFDTLEFARRPVRPDLARRATTRALPTDATNLVVRAAERLRAEAGVDRGATIALRKAIPAQAGLAGGFERRGGDAGGPGSAVGSGLAADTPGGNGRGRSAATWPSSSTRPAAVCRGRGERVEPVGSGIAPAFRPGLPARWA